MNARILLARMVGLTYSRTARLFGVPYAAWTALEREVHRARTFWNTALPPLGPPIQCRTCLLDTRFPDVFLESDGICNHCHAFLRRHDPARCRRSLDAFLALPGGGRYDAILALSGGKDSSAALVLAATRFRLRLLAVTVDNGFLPEVVIERARGLAGRLGVPHRVVRAEIAPEVRRALANRLLNPWPCFSCFERIAQATLAACREEGARRIILGMRYFWDPDFDCVVSADWAFRYFSHPVVRDVRILNLLPAVGLTEAEEMKLLDAWGWVSAGVPGSGTNCLLHGYMERAYRRRFGFYREAHRLLSQEVRAGFLTKDEAIRKLAEPEITEGVEREILDRLRGAGAGGAGPPH